VCTADFADTDPDLDAHGSAAYGDVHCHGSIHCYHSTYCYPRTHKHPHCHRCSTHTDLPLSNPISHRDGDCGSAGGCRHTGCSNPAPWVRPGGSGSVG